MDKQELKDLAELTGKKTASIRNHFVRKRWSIYNMDNVREFLIRNLGAMVLDNKDNLNK